MRRKVLPFQSRILRQLAVPAAIFLLGIGSAAAQSGDNHGKDQNKAATVAAEANKENERRTAEFAEAAQAINGPAGNPECVWLGRRGVRLMVVRALETAVRP